jgi:flagellar secretion chaperone FliS
MTPQNAYLDASVATASPARLLVMLCDRLVLDLTRGLDAQRGGDLSAAHAQLLHAQEIVLELRSSLRTTEWDGALQLASLYDFLHLELVRANVTKDASITEGCLGLVSDLADTWREAAMITTAAVAS